MPDDHNDPHVASLLDALDKTQARAERAEALLAAGDKPSLRLEPALGKPIADLQLSVRARKRMNRLGVATVGDLVTRTADDLLEGAKNFGPSSLSEVREKLARYGLALRGETLSPGPDLQAECDSLKADVAKLQAQVRGHCERIAAASEVIGSFAEVKGYDDWLAARERGRAWLGGGK